MVKAESAVASARAALAGDPRHRDRPRTRRCSRRSPRCTAPSSTSRAPTVTAPAAGIVSQTDRLQVGQYVTPAVPVLSLVATGATWIEANYKETDLTHMRRASR